jgi:uncharacterized SAM-binding protein YcdF (DUF218 family)
MTVALILGAAVWAGGPSPTLRRRVMTAAALWHAGEVSHVICCGGLGRHPPTEAEVMRDILRAEGVAEAAILLEDRSTTTAENVALALPLLAALGERRVIMVTDWYHAPRARMTARRMGLVADSRSPSLRGTRPVAQVRLALREVGALAVYCWRLPVSGRRRR